LPVPVLRTAFLPKFAGGKTRAASVAVASLTVSFANSAVKSPLLAAVPKERSYQPMACVMKIRSHDHVYLRYDVGMSLNEVLNALPTLTTEELSILHGKIGELLGQFDSEGWINDGSLTDEDKRVLKESLDEYERNPNRGQTWGEVRSRILTRSRSLEK